MKRAALLACALLAGFAIDCQGYDCNGQPISFGQAMQQASANATVNGAPGGTCYTLSPPSSKAQSLTDDAGDVDTDAGDVDTNDAGDVDAGEDGGP